MAEIRIDPLSGLRTIVDSGGLPPQPLGVAKRSPGEPLLRPDAPAPAPQDNPVLFAALAARGSHEVLARPAGPFAELDVEQAQAAVELWRERMRAHPGAAYVHMSVDEPGRAELLALDFVPAAVARERERFSAHAVRTMGANLLEDLVADEVRLRARIVAIDDEAVLMCPYASRHPYQLMLAPRRRRARFEDDGATGAALLHRGLRLLAQRFVSSPPLSLWVRTAPRGAERFCWRIDIVPRLVQAGGLELGTGLARNPVAPETAAAELRERHRAT
jgi:UDPglucose--hexose-1-phosphate uridylyltransferase